MYITCNEYFKHIINKKIGKIEICENIVDLRNKPKALQI
jgi:hypothetical protein